MLCCGYYVGLWFISLKDYPLNKLHHYYVQEIWILELGGVGHIGVKIAKALGHHVTVISSSDKKRKEALEVLGADEYVVSKDTTQMQVCFLCLSYTIET